VCHGVPSPDVWLEAGDIVNVDVTTEVDGYHGDTSATFPVGKASADALRLRLSTRAISGLFRASEAQVDQSPRPKSRRRRACV